VPSSDATTSGDKKDGDAATTTTGVEKAKVVDEPSTFVVHNPARVMRQQVCYCLF
jgi:hypothetical protein